MKRTILFSISVVWLSALACAAALASQVTGAPSPRGPLEILCPTDISVGITNLPAGWATFSGEKHLFSSSGVDNSVKGGPLVTCTYAKGGAETYTIGRQAPASYTCKATDNGTPRGRRIITCAPKKPPIKTK
jgi:hypothetical protein